jgi:hypothetical protein
MVPVKQNQTRGSFAILNALNAHAQAVRIVPAPRQSLPSQKQLFPMIYINYLRLLGNE